MELKKMLKYRLPFMKSEKYLEFIKQEGKDRHHIVGRNNDYLITNLSRAEHTSRHSSGHAEFEEDLVSALTNLFKYVRYLENNPNKSK